MTVEAIDLTSSCCIDPLHQPFDCIIVYHRRPRRSAAFVLRGRRAMTADVASAAKGDVIRAEGDVARAVTHVTRGPSVPTGAVTGDGARAVTGEATSAAIRDATVAGT